MASKLNPVDWNQVASKANGRTAASLRLSMSTARNVGRVGSVDETKQKVFKQKLQEFVQGLQDNYIVYRQKYGGEIQSVFEYDHEAYTLTNNGHLSFYSFTGHNNTHNLPKVSVSVDEMKILLTNMKKGLSWNTLLQKRFSHVLSQLIERFNELAKEAGYQQGGKTGQKKPSKKSGFAKSKTTTSKK